MMTETVPRDGDLSPPESSEPPRLDSPFDGNLDLAALQRALSEMYGYDVDIDRYVELVTDPAQWDMPRFSEELGVPKGTINSWRNNTKKRGGADRTALPVEQDKAGQSPWWYAGTLRRWAIWYGWMRPDGTPTRPMPPGKGAKPSSP